MWRTNRLSGVGARNVCTSKKDKHFKILHKKVSWLRAIKKEKMMMETVSVVLVELVRDWFSCQPTLSGGNAPLG